VLLAGALAFGTTGARAENGEEGGEDEKDLGGARWTLELEHGPLRIVRVSVKGKPATYHYMVLEATNPTDEELPWQPFAQAVTDTERTATAVGFGHAIEAVRRQEKDNSLVPIEKTQGTIGPKEKKKGVAIFGPLDPQYDEVRVQIHGLVDPITIYKFETYGDRVVIVDAAYWERNKKILDEVAAEARREGASFPVPEVAYREVVERRVYEIHYSRPGDEFSTEDDLISFRSQGWKVLEEPKILRTIGQPSEDEPAADE
jgi:hypothetical protein